MLLESREASGWDAKAVAEYSPIYHNSSVLSPRITLLRYWPSLYPNRRSRSNVSSFKIGSS